MTHVYRLIFIRDYEALRAKGGLCLALKLGLPTSAFRVIFYLLGTSMVSLLAFVLKSDSTYEYKRGV